MSLTANFDYCVELGIGPVRSIFHLAFKNEQRFPHNVGPFVRNFSGRTVNVSVFVLDDDTDPADLTFADPKHISFSFPFDITVEVPDAPDPSLSRITLKSRVNVPALLSSWTEDGADVLGLDFAGVTPSDVDIVSLDGLPSLDASSFEAAVHSRYAAMSTHSFSFAGNTLLLYDGSRDPGLDPPNAATPFEITTALEDHGGIQFVKLTAPIHVSVPLAAGYQSYGRIQFWREVVSGETTVTVNMAQEPADASLKTVVELDQASFARDAIIAALTPMAVNALAGFGTITEPAFSDAGARTLLQNEIANYLQPLRFPVYTPRSGDPNVPLSTPVGFLLPADGVLAILMNRRDDTVADSAPDNFLGGRQVALAVGRARFMEFIAAAIQAQFPGLNNGGAEVHTSQGDATLKSLSVDPSDPGEHDQGRGHLWTSGEAEVHIDCWPDPDVSFAGPIFLNATATETDQACSLDIDAQAGDFDFDESCCDVFLDLIIPIVGWMMLAVVESTIGDVGGELAGQIAGEQGRTINAIPPVVNGVAEVQACLEDLLVQRQGVVLPGKLRVRRLGTSFEDLAANGDLPRP
ncbi:hypothetical protein [Paraburkholderia sp. XV]|uniref:hypothetical protein n=1 Tax=Paraburkholderia sp. XV TaxID=2831520 RepID=UPI001CD1D8A8|nr:hypothetical protein [Paraburkholderia sp. XV]